MKYNKPSRQERHEIMVYDNKIHDRFTVDVFYLQANDLVPKSMLHKKV